MYFNIEYRVRKTTKLVYNVMVYRTNKIDQDMLWFKPNHNLVNACFTRLITSRQNAGTKKSHLVQIFSGRKKVLPYPAMVAEMVNALLLNHVR